MSHPIGENEDVIGMLVESNLKMASIAAGLLYACRYATINNGPVNVELDRTHEELRQYIEEAGKAAAKINAWRGEDDRT